jgi:hypothetical protein
MMITDGPARFDRISLEPLLFDGDNRTPIGRYPDRPVGTFIQSEYGNLLLR